MCRDKVIVAVVSSALVTILFLLFSVITPINQQEASTFFHENLFASSINANAQLTTDAQSSTNAPPTASSKQTGTPGDDNLRGTEQNDVLVGLAGNDIIVGQAGNDNIDGSEGNDYLIGGPGADTLAGGLGQDKFICGQGKDAMLDFNATEGDSRTVDCETAATTTTTTTTTTNTDDITGE